MREVMLDGMAQTAADRAEPVLRPGNTNCGGCGMSVGLQFLTHAIGQRQVQFAIPLAAASSRRGHSRTRPMARRRRHHLCRRRGRGHRPGARSAVERRAHPRHLLGRRWRHL